MGRQKVSYQTVQVKSYSCLFFPPQKLVWKIWKPTYWIWSEKLRDGFWNLDFAVIRTICRPSRWPYGKDVKEDWKKCSSVLNMQVSKRVQNVIQLKTIHVWIKYRFYKRNTHIYDVCLERKKNKSMSIGTCERL